MVRASLSPRGSALIFGSLSGKKGLIGAGLGLRERALHEQWCSFALTEVEGYLWSFPQARIILSR
ncbi:MAG: hypothetical protein CM1200mP4_3520 [Rhodospirillaceae bacterium]|nr:MAG: hypothetical protein CM1200mP4_3520 [Rhodospirillaceae bacterium]